jgi:DNA-binding CsgD family transcriptional regulator
MTPDTQKLTSMERRIMPLLANGYSNAEIADFLGLSESTVKYHLTGVYTNLCVRSRVEAAVLWVREQEVLAPEVAAVAATLVDLMKRRLPPHISEADQVEAYLALHRISSETGGS